MDEVTRTILEVIAEVAMIAGFFFLPAMVWTRITQGTWNIFRDDFFD
jgi:hypothetical protein